MTGEREGASRSALALKLNSIGQLVTNARGRVLDAATADRIMRRVEEARQIIKGRPAPKVQTSTTRYRLWQRSPLCLWCGVTTQLEEVHAADAATIDHLHRQGERAGRALPPYVLACRRCNNSRGEPRRVRATCPVLISVND